MIKLSYCSKVLQLRSVNHGASVSVSTSGGLEDIPNLPTLSSLSITYLDLDLSFYLDLGLYLDLALALDPAFESSNKIHTYNQRTPYHFCGRNFIPCPFWPSYVA